MLDRNEESSSLANASDKLLIEAIKKIAYDRTDDTGQNFLNDLEDIKVVDNQLLISTKECRQAKYHIRDKLFTDQLKLPVTNIEGHFGFSISREALLENETILKGMQELKQLDLDTQQKNYKFESSGASRGAAVEGVVLYIGEIAVGRVLINKPLSTEISLARVDIFPPFQKKGYGTLLMDYIMDLCLKRDVDISIDVDKARNTQDDPLVFYSKYLEARNIIYSKGREASSIFFKCQTTISINISDIIKAKCKMEKPSNMSSRQFLATQLYGFSVEAIQKKPLTRGEFLVLSKGLTVEEMQKASQQHIELMLEKNILSWSSIKDLNNSQLKLLYVLPDDMLARQEIYETVKKISLSILNDNQFAILSRIVKMKPEIILTNEMDQLISYISPFTSLQLKVLESIRNQDCLNKETYETISGLNEKQMKILTMNTMGPLDSIQRKKTREYGSIVTDLDVVRVFLSELKAEIVKIKIPQTDRKPLFFSSQQQNELDSTKNLSEQRQEGPKN